MTADLSALIARLEAAEVGSRELDAHLWDLEDDRPRHDLDGDGAIYKQDPVDTVAFDSPPPFTTSLDAALALAERVLPGCRCLAGSRGLKGDKARAAIIPATGRMAGAKAASPSLALVIAILRAKQGEGG